MCSTKSCELVEGDLQDTDSNSTLSRSQRRQSTFTAGSCSSRRHSTVSECSNMTITHFTGAQKKNELYSNYLKCKGKLMVSPVYENTYRLGPASDQLLNQGKIRQLVDKILEQHFMPVDYDGQESKKVLNIQTLYTLTILLVMLVVMSFNCWSVIGTN